MRGEFCLSLSLSLSLSLILTFYTFTRRRPQRRWEDNIKTDLQEVGGLWGLDVVGSGYGQVAGTCECGNELTGSVKCGEFLD
jgi:hypothetical protein